MMLFAAWQQCNRFALIDMNTNMKNIGSQALMINARRLNTCYRSQLNFRRCSRLPGKISTLQCTWKIRRCNRSRRKEASQSWSVSHCRLRSEKANSQDEKPLDSDDIRWKAKASITATTEGEGKLNMILPGIGQRIFMKFLHSTLDCSWCQSARSTINYNYKNKGNVTNFTGCDEQNLKFGHNCFIVKSSTGDGWNYCGFKNDSTLKQLIMNYRERRKNCRGSHSKVKMGTHLRTLRGDITLHSATCCTG